MEDYLLQSVERTLMSELQAKGYAPHISDVKPAAAKVIALVEADLKSRLTVEKPAPVQTSVIPQAAVTSQAVPQTQAVSPQTQLPQKS